MSVRRLVLASQSPRRRQILTISGYDFDILPSQISEIPDENLNLSSQIRQLASDKAEACLKMGKWAPGQGILVLASDTVVVFADQIIGKPKDEKEARIVLGRLSNQVHEVITAVSLIDVQTGRRLSDHAVTKVQFRELSDVQIADYVATGDPLDKAGSYGIQNALAANFVESFEGDYDTIVGLPMAIVEKCFAALDVQPERRISPIGDNIRSVKSKVANASPVANQPARLVAVSKTKPAIDVIDAYLSGQRIFAENYVQEALPKITEVADLLRISKRSQEKSLVFEEPIEWHFIGSIQSKKVKQIVGNFELIHSVDRISLVEEIEKRAAAVAIERSKVAGFTFPGFKQNILLQINIADEATKSGASREEFFDLFEAAMKCGHVRLCGVMALPPLTEDESLARSRFAAIRIIFEEARRRLSPEQKSDFAELSMGTTHDYELAIAEGATLVRIGTALFGARSV
jgi:MAF protein